MSNRCEDLWFCQVWILQPRAAEMCWLTVTGYAEAFASLGPPSMIDRTTKLRQKWTNGEVRAPHVIAFDILVALCSGQEGQQIRAASKDMVIKWCTTSTWRDRQWWKKKKRWQDIKSSIYCLWERAWPLVNCAWLGLGAACLFLPLPPPIFGVSPPLSRGRCPVGILCSWDDSALTQIPLTERERP